MRWLFTTRRQSDRRIRARDERIGQLLQRAEDAETRAAALDTVAAELSRCKDVIALHIVAAGHPSTVLHDPARIGEALREELAANRVDLRLELARLEGADL